ncbi:hypothetical protein [Amycolatopsis samaneae]|uniref:Uncharacterized protein n=1 Tax=Amycolatopsis samaneae TaxID=664691 RepID=A0ABW5GJ04_9PSEU
MTVELGPPVPPAVVAARVLVPLLAAGVATVTGAMSYLWQLLARCAGDLLTDGCQRRTDLGPVWWTLLPAAVGVPCAIAAIVVVFTTNRAARAWTGGLVLLGIGALQPAALLLFFAVF